jgi:hypothetical protein
MPATLTLDLESSVTTCNKMACRALARHFALTAATVSEGRGNGVATAGQSYARPDVPPIRTKNWLGYDSGPTCLPLAPTGESSNQIVRTMPTGARA